MKIKSRLSHYSSYVLKGKNTKKKWNTTKKDHINEKKIHEAALLEQCAKGEE